MIGDGGWELCSDIHLRARDAQDALVTPEPMDGREGGLAKAAPRGGERRNPTPSKLQAIPKPVGKGA
jgi:hypothetical protein